MPNGIPVATVAIDGAMNAGLLAATIISLQDRRVSQKLEKYMSNLTNSIKKRPR